MNTLQIIEITIATFALLSAAVLLTIFVIAPAIKEHIRRKNELSEKNLQISVRYDQVYCEGVKIHLKDLKKVLNDKFTRKQFFYGNKRIELKKDVFGKDFFNIEILNSIEFFEQNKKHFANANSAIILNENRFNFFW